MPARADIPLPLACGSLALECGHPPLGCAAARAPPPPLECAAALLPPPDFCLPAKASCGAINVRETQIQMNALMNCISTSFYGNGETKFAGPTQIFFAKAVIWSCTSCQHQLQSGGKINCGTAQAPAKETGARPSRLELPYANEPDPQIQNRARPVHRRGGIFETAR